MYAWEIISGDGVDALHLGERETPIPGPGQVRVRMNANSINYRDLITIEGAGARKLPFSLVPNSDGAGVITAVGEGVKLKEGDRVTSCFFEEWVAGEISAPVMASALGGARQGVLAEEVILPEDGVIHTPAGLTDEEASTLPCAALTAWHALTLPRPVKAGETVLLLGTGGVSVFAQQFCTMMGARTIVTSSSDDKLEKMKSLGAGEVINYRTNPEWDAAVLELTGGSGVDRVVEVGGPGTFDRSVNAVRVGGIIGLIGVLTGMSGATNPTSIMRKSITVRGIYVGSRAMFGDMNRAIEAHNLKPMIDQTFDFKDARSAYHAMRGAGHFGKLVIKM
ncbi:MAG: NAD(P)-dependent alcohol dehydrogenase [Rhodospirillales bacterium]|jgi:NADPH:quinone reductase-like Zn-dependent oxidoreductase|tara:strand:+ start:440 stop:1447 length:1008 start_codon:yes stop_codon:yes gene_type:complete